MKRIAIIGCGAIGGVVARGIDRGEVEAELIALMDIASEVCRKLASDLKRFKPIITNNIDDVLSLKPDIVVEAASQDAVKQYGERVLRISDLVVMSIGALMDGDLFKKLIDVASMSGRRIYIPSGAIGGLDILKEYAKAGVTRLKLTTRKPAKTLGVATNEPITVFRGRASEAVRRYPRSLNIAATISIATGVEAEVELVADPNIDRNIHEIEVESPAGRVRITLENIPLPENPRTSYLAALSVLRVLSEICNEKQTVVIL